MTAISRKKNFGSDVLTGVKYLTNVSYEKKNC